MLDGAAEQNDPAVAQELFGVAWRIGQLLRKNERLESLIAAAPDGFAASLNETLRTLPARPQTWEDGFETHCVVYMKAVARSLSDPARGQVADSAGWIDSLEARNRVLREVLRHSDAPTRAHSEMQEWRNEVSAEIREQGECSCGCRCHLCKKCFADLRRLQRWNCSKQG